MMTSSRVAMSRAGATPVMAFGGGAKRWFSAIRSGKRWTPIVPGKRFGGPGMSDGGDGGDVAEPAPESGDEDGGSNPLESLWKSYEEALDTKPLLMKALTSMVGFALGDILAQKFITKGDWDM